MSLERDENFVPRTRSDYQLPAENKATLKDYHDIFEDMPIVSLARMLFMQALGMQFYLMRNSMGSPMYPPGTNVCLVSPRTLTYPQIFYLSILSQVPPSSNPMNAMALLHQILDSL